MNRHTIFFNPLFYLFFSVFLLQSHSQQTYVNNKQNDCYREYDGTDGNLCNGLHSCSSYLTFRSHPPYDTATQIAYLLNSDPSMIVQINKNINDVEKIPTDTLVIVPITNCSCSGNFYQQYSSYTLKHPDETYFSLANNTYQGLTTCQALIKQNPSHDSRNLTPGIQLSVPVRCACPTQNQTDSGVKFLLSYLINWRDKVSTISDGFGVDEKDILNANKLSKSSLIFPFTPLLIPLKDVPAYNPGAKSPPVSQPPTIPATPTPTESSNSSNMKWIFVGIGVGVVFLIISLGLLYVFFFRRKSQKPSKINHFSSSTDYTPTSGNKSDSALVSSRDVRLLVDNSSLNVYKFEELQRATAQFSEDNRIRGSVYRGVINGDTAAIKGMNEDALNEINVLKQIHHSSVIRLSGYCMHESNVYLVYEFAEMGSLSDWLHQGKSWKDPIDTISWKQRIQISYDIADGLNYLHSYATPPYIHRNLKSSNILLNGGFRAKIANFGMARTVNGEEEKGSEEALQLTRHVVGTQGYMAPEYIENGMVSPKMDVFAFGVVMLELLSGKEAVTFSTDNEDKTTKMELYLFGSINQVLEGENVREKLRSFIDPSLKREYPLDLAFSMAQLAKNCVAHDPNSRPTMYDVYISLSKMLSSSLDWDPSDELQLSSMASH